MRILLKVNSSEKQYDGIAYNVTSLPDSTNTKAFYSFGTEDKPSAFTYFIENTTDGIHYLNSNNFPASKLIGYNIITVNDEKVHEINTIYDVITFAAELGISDKIK